MAKDIIEPIESFKDFLGQTVRVGDHVVYATVSGRSPVQKLAVVEKIETVQKWERHARYVKTDGDWHWVGVHSAPRFRVGVRELSNGRGFTRWDRQVYDESRPLGQRYVRDAKPARVTYPMDVNIVKVADGRCQGCGDPAFEGVHGASEYGGCV